LTTAINDLPLLPEKKEVWNMPGKETEKGKIIS
jgi:hypothetical protein